MGELFYLKDGSLVNVSRGTKGDQGDVGPQGPPGPVVPLDDLTDVNAPNPTDRQFLSWDEPTQRWVARTSLSSLGIVSFQYTFGVATDATPNAGHVHANANPVGDATLLYIHKENRDGEDVTLFLENITAGCWINMFDYDLSSRFVAYDVTGPPTLVGDVFHVPITLFDGEGPPLTNNTRVSLFIRYVTPTGDTGPHVLEGDKDNPPAELADYQLLYDPNEPGPDYPVLASPWALVGATTMVIPKNSSTPDTISNWSSFLTNAPDWFELVDNQTLRVVQPGWYQVTICCPIQSAAATGPMTFASRIDVSLRARIEGNPPSGSDSAAGTLPVTPYGSRTPALHVARVRWTTPRLLYLTMADRDTANSGATWQAATPILVRVERIGEP